MPSVDELVREALPLVSQLARQLKRNLRLAAEVEDLEGAGHETLFAAAQAFDPSLGVPFRRYANLRVRGGMIDFIRSTGNVPRSMYAKLRALEAIDRVESSFTEGRTTPRVASAQQADDEISKFLAQATTAAALGLIGVRPLEDARDVVDDNEDGFDVTLRSEISAMIRAAIAERPDQERHLLTRHYFDGVPVDEAAREIGLSKSWASRLHARAIEGLERSLRRANFKP